MATTDSNGLVLLQQTDNLTPLEGTINTVTSSVSAAFNANTRIFQVANQAARDTLANSRTPTANNPLFVWRQDTKKMEYNYGTGWGPFPPEAPDPNIITINGVEYQRSGTVTTPQLTFQPVGSLFFAYVDAYLPTPPSGYALTVSVVATSAASVWVSRSNANHIILANNTNSRSITLHWQLVKL